MTDQILVRGQPAYTDHSGDHARAGAVTGDDLSIALGCQDPTQNTRAIVVTDGAPSVRVIETPAGSAIPLGEIAAAELASLTLDLAGVYRFEVAGRTLDLLVFPRECLDDRDIAIGLHGRQRDEAERRAMVNRVASKANPELASVVLPTLLRDQLEVVGALCHEVRAYPVPSEPWPTHGNVTILDGGTLSRLGCQANLLASFTV